MIDYQITLVFTLDLYNSMKIRYVSNEMYHSILVMIQMQKKCYRIHKHFRKCAVCQYISIGIITKCIAINR